jgi:hypothetical protein
MTFKQTVEIPEDRRLTIEIPREFPAGAATLAFTPKPASPADKKAAQARLQETELKAAIARLQDLAKDFRFSSEDLFEERRKDREMDEAQYRRLFHKNGDAD